MPEQGGGAPWLLPLADSAGENPPPVRSEKTHPHIYITVRAKMIISPTGDRVGGGKRG